MLPPALQAPVRVCRGHRLLTFQDASRHCEAAEHSHAYNLQGSLPAMGLTSCDWPWPLGAPGDRHWKPGRKCQIPAGSQCLPKIPSQGPGLAQTSPGPSYSCLGWLLSLVPEVRRILPVCTDISLTSASSLPLLT